MAWASAMAWAPSASSARLNGTPAAAGENEIVDRRVLASTETKIRSGRPVMRGWPLIIRAPGRARRSRPSSAGRRCRPRATGSLAMRRRSRIAGRAAGRPGREIAPRASCRAMHRPDRGSAPSAPRRHRAPTPRPARSTPRERARRSQDSPASATAAVVVAPAAPPPTATAATPTTTEPARATARAALLGDIDPQRAAGEVLAIEIGNRLLGGVGGRHLDEAEPPRLTAHAVDHQVDAFDLSRGREVLGDQIFSGVIGQVSNIQAARHGALNWLSGHATDPWSHSGHVSRPHRGLVALTERHAAAINERASRLPRTADTV